LHLVGLGKEWVGEWWIVMNKEDKTETGQKTYNAKTSAQHELTSSLFQDQRLCAHCRLLAALWHAR
jgi:hypothetical protein